MKKPSKLIIFHCWTYIFPKSRNFIPLQMDTAIKSIKMLTHFVFHLPAKCFSCNFTNNNETCTHLIAEYCGNIILRPLIRSAIKTVTMCCVHAQICHNRNVLVQVWLLVVSCIRIKSPKTSGWSYGTW